MNSASQLAAEIETRFWGELKPDDCFEDAKKILDSGCVTDQFFADLLFFTEAIHGYAATARALPGLDPARLPKVDRDVAKPFFERYPHYESCRNLITERDTPRLYRQLEKVENYRRDVLSLVRSLPGNPAP